MIHVKSTHTAPRIQELDALRGIAALAVLACHLPRGFWFGETGVDLFFVLSGFLITGVILRGVDQPDFLAKFYWRRSLRIFPVYYLVLFLAYGVNRLRATPQDTAGFPFYLVYLQHVHEYWGSSTPPTDISLGHTWTLAIEEQFYLFWPVLVVVSKRRVALLLAGLFVVLPMALRHLGLPKAVLLGHSEGLALGALLAWIEPSTRSVPQKIKACCYASVAIVGLIGYWAFYWTLGSVNPAFTGKEFLAMNPSVSIISGAYFGLIGFTVCMSGSRWIAVLRNRYLVGLGTVSYGLYLYHWVLYEYLDTLVKFRWQLGDPWWLDTIKVVSSLAVAIVSWHWFEQPILRLKEYFNYQRDLGASAVPMSLTGMEAMARHE